MKRELEHIEIPGEHDARERAWELVLAAYADREPTTRRRLPVRLLVAAAAAAALVAAILSPPGRALLDEVREVIGVEGAAPALFDLPDGGRLLVQSDEGPWIVQPDGSKRLLGRYREASWSPFGRFVVATRENELVALEPDGDVRWKLARPDVKLPRWGGTRIDTRIAYISEDLLRVVAGDGHNDRAFAGPVAPVAPAWHPTRRHVLAFVAHDRRVYVYEADSRRQLWKSRPLEAPTALEWSPDGARLLAVARDRLVIFGRGGRRLSDRLIRGVVDAAFAPDGRLALLLPTELRVQGRRLFAGQGRFTALTWSPDGRWVLVAWPDANQWVFVSAEGKRRIEAVSGIPSQFESSLFPGVEGWCCASR